jgi:negative regulator of sigma-B (phosphoserine phosphatase)
MSAAALEIVHGSVPCVGEIANGDAVVVRHFDGGALVAVIDALGHGRKAADDLAATKLAAVPLDAGSRGVLDILDLVHDALRGSRGAAAMICVVEQDRIEGCGVGNVELRCAGVSLPVVLSPGILGVGKIRMRPFAGRLSPGCRLYMFSDGISRRAPFTELARLPADEACRELLDRYRRNHDDASVLVLST